VLAVFFPVFARLQDDRRRLSQAFVRSSGAVVRAGLAVALCLGVAASELTALLLGARWLPMVPAFRILLLVTVLEPLLEGAVNLHVAVGRTGTVVAARTVQLLVLVPAVVGLGRWLGIAGVAVAAVLAALAGCLALFRAARPLVDFSATRLLAWPLLAAGLAVCAVVVARPLWGGWPTAAALAGKALLAAAVYLAVVWWCERTMLREGWRTVLAHLRAPATDGRG
jgi:O-antigen/teichoic acid export membrane protein